MIWITNLSQELGAGPESKLEPDIFGRENSDLFDLPPIVNASDWVNGNACDAPPLIVKKLLHRGSKAIIAGPSKAGKTWFFIHLALSVATGTKFLNWETAPGKVLYINLELQNSFFRQRLKKVAEALSQRMPETLHVWNLRGRAAPLGVLVPAILDKVEKSRYDLIIVDPIYKALGNADENSAGDITSLCNDLEVLAVKSGAAVVYAAHYSKGNQSAKEAIDRVSGSGVFSRDADVIINLTTHEVADCFSVEVVLRNLPPYPPFVVEREFPVFSIRPDLDPAALKRPVRGWKPRAPDGSDERSVLAVIPGYPQTVSQKDLFAHLRGSLSEKRIRALILNLVESKKIETLDVQRKGARPMKHYRRASEAKGDVAAIPLGCG